MSGAALGLVLLAAVAHAVWNLLARRAEEKLAFLWCGTLVTTVLFLPLGVWLLATTPLSPVGLGHCGRECVPGSLVLLDARAGVPLRRAVAGLPDCAGDARRSWCRCWRSLFLGERLSGLAAGGIGLVVVGTVVIHIRQLGWPTAGG